MKKSEGFNKFYHELYGERWPELKASLLAPTKHAAWVSPYGDGVHPGGENFLDFANVFLCEGRVEAPSGIPRGYYLLDPASLFPPSVLAPSGNDRVLDLCAAPGGKSLIIESMLGSDGHLVANDRSNDRRGRLKNVFMEYLPQERQAHVEVRGHDASRWGLYEQDIYDKILLDAPCSSERHVLMSDKHLQQWSIKRTKALAIEQAAMLLSALSAVKVGGRIVYSTCALSQLENDGVIAKVLRKRPDQIQVETLDLPIGEKTEFGWHILPDRTGFGPIYLASLIRLS